MGYTQDMDNLLEIDNKSKYICPECKGNKYITCEVEVIEIVSFGMRHRIPGKMNTSNCNTCNGNGYIDWVEKVLK